MGITEATPDEAQGTSPWWIRRPAWLLALIWLLLCLKWLRGSRTMPYDAAQQFFPAVSFVARQLRELQWPWWNPYLFGGYPQLADPQMMTFQPTLVLPMMLAPTSLHLFGIVVMLHVMLAGFGAVRLARHYHWQPAAQLLFALVWMFGGVMASRLQHTPMIISATMLPWLWLYLSRLRRTRNWRDAACAGIWGGLIALQLTQVTYFIILAGIAYAAGSIVVTRPGRAGLAVRFAGVGVLAALVSSPQWLFTLAYLPYTNRTGLELGDATAGSLDERALLTLLSGNFFEQGSGRYWGQGDITQDYLYFGAVPLAIWLLWGGAAALRQRGRVALALVILVFALLFALGTHAPLFPSLHAWFPGLSLFRRPADLLFFSVPAFAWLAAVALQARLEGEPVRPHWPSVMVVLVLLGYGFWIALVDDPHPRALLFLLGSGMLATAASLVLAKSSHTPRPWALALVIALVAIDYRAFNVAQSFNAGPRSQFVLAKQETLDQVFARRERDVPGDGIPLRANVYGIPSLLNGATVRQLPLLDGYNPMYASSYARMTGVGAFPPTSPDAKEPTEWASGAEAPLWDLLGLRVTIASTPFKESMPAGKGDFHVRFHDVRFPRVLNPTQVKRHPGDLPPSAVFNRTNFRTELWLPQYGAATPCPDINAGTVQVDAIHYRANQIDLDYRANAPAWLVVNEVIAPGWLAEIDGRHVSLQRGNGLFRAVCVPAGHARLSLRFSPAQLLRDGWEQWRKSVVHARESPL